MQLMLENGRLVPAFCTSQVLPPSLVWKMRPRSPTAHPSVAELKHVENRFCRNPSTSIFWAAAPPHQAQSAMTKAAAPARERFTNIAFPTLSIPVVDLLKCLNRGGRLNYVFEAELDVVAILQQA